MATNTVLEVPPIKVGKMKMTLVGENRLVSNRFHEKAIQTILDTQTGKPKQGKEPKMPIDCFMRALYIIPGSPTPIVHGKLNFVAFKPSTPIYIDETVDAKEVADSEEQMIEEGGSCGIWATGNFGFPAIGFKAAAVRAGTDADLKMTDLRRAFHIPCELVEIITDHGPQMRMDMVRVGMGQADIRFRPEFLNWKATVEILYNKAVINISQIANLFRLAGFGVGIGEWRPEKKGMWGTFTVDNNIDDLGEMER